MHHDQEAKALYSEDGPGAAKPKKPTGAGQTLGGGTASTGQSEKVSLPQDAREKAAEAAEARRKAVCGVL